MRTIAFPLVSAGVYAWPLDDAVDAAVGTVASAETGVEEVRFVALSADVVGRIAERVAAC